MNKLLISLACVAALSGCATSDSAPAGKAEFAQTEAAPSKRYDYEATTGSRLPPRKTHERLVKSTEGGDYRKDSPTESLGNVLNSSINKGSN